MKAHARLFSPVLLGALVHVLGCSYEDTSLTDGESSDVEDEVGSVQQAICPPDAPCVPEVDADPPNTQPTTSMPSIGFQFSALGNCLPAASMTALVNALAQQPELGGAQIRGRCFNNTTRVGAWFTTATTSAQETARQNGLAAIA